MHPIPLNQNTPIHHAPFSGAPDLPRLRALLAACYADGPVDYSLAKLAQSTPISDTPVRDGIVGRIWHAATSPDEPIAVAALHGARNLVFQIHPATRLPHVEHSVLHWIDEQIRHAGHARPNARVQASLDSGQDHYRCALLERAGFTRTESTVRRMARPLGEPSPVPEPALPPGFRIRTVDTDANLARFIALFHDSFGDGPTIESRRRLRQRSNHLPELVVENPEGLFLSFCCVQLHHSEQLPLTQGEAIVYQLGTARAHWNCGYGRAALRAGLLQMKDNGAHTAHLQTPAHNARTQHLFESEGFHTTALITTVRYSKATGGS